MSTTTGTDADNPFVQVIATDGDDRWPTLSDDWADLLAVLSEGTYTMAELIATTGIPRRTVKGLLYHGRRAGRVWRGNTQRREEVAPDLWTVYSVLGFRALP
ncbi:hypothetical protein [Microbacterium sp. GXF6406]